MNIKSLILSFFLTLPLHAEPQTSPLEPKALQIPHQLTIHGHTRNDPYFWLKDKKDPKVLSYLRLENAYADKVMKGTKPLQDKLYKEMRERVKEEDQSAPYKKGHYFYYSKTKKGQEYRIYCRKKTLDSKEEVLLDVNELGKGKDYIDVTPPHIHPDENLMSFAVDTKGDRTFTIYFKDLKTSSMLSTKIENTTGNQAWAESGKILFYGTQDPQTLRSDKIFRLDLGTGERTLVYEEKDEKFDVYVYKTLSKKFLVIASESTLASEVRTTQAQTPDAPFKVFLPREANHEYQLDDDGEHFIIRTNWAAKNFRVMKAAYEAASKKDWREIIPHRPDVFIEDVRAFRNHLVASVRQNGLTLLWVLKSLHTTYESILFPDPAYVVGLDANEEFDTRRVRYNFTSLNRPPSIFDFDVETKKSLLVKEIEVPHYDVGQYVSERAYATASDGAQIPLSIVYKKGFKRDGSAPLLLYGYGAYGISMEPYFSSARMGLLDRGFVFAIAHVRGGQEMGKDWYENGKFLKKMNSFKDFIDATSFLVEKKYAHPQKIYAKGESAGGLLMGAVMNMRPDLYHGIIARVPFVDIVTTMLDSSLPLTTGEYEEWGNPNDQQYYTYMLSYSPYDNVKKANYPNLLVTAGLNDSQVSYWEPAKWVAKLRDLRTDKNKLLIMKIEMEAGHGGKSGRFQYLKDEAFEQAFLLKLAKIND